MQRDVVGPRIRRCEDQVMQELHARSFGVISDVGTSHYTDLPGNTPRDNARIRVEPPSTHGTRHMPFRGRRRYRQQQGDRGADTDRALYDDVATERPDDLARLIDADAHARVALRRVERLEQPSANELVAHPFTGVAHLD